ncbi:MAG TPA: diaminopimelate epimerase [Gemmatimonadaceae bacterium]|nr:diaminopimelate epimerase [Gemmatimonadaceae bacterium]
MAAHGRLASGRRFYKMTGSGNDFVVLDGIAEPLTALPETAAVAGVCDRRGGVGADGVVVLERSASAAARMIYFNRDGSRGEMCGNAALCSTRLMAELGHVGGEVDAFTLETDSGFLTVGLTAKAGVPSAPDAPRSLTPWIELPEAAEVDLAVALSPQQGEVRFGFARVGVPHLVVLCEPGHEPLVDQRGRELRHSRQFRDGANVNFVVPRVGTTWRIRTFERGVEGETLACGTGTGASALLLAAWGLAPGPIVEFESSSGKPLAVELPGGDATGNRARLRGEGRLVFGGELRELA